MQKKYLAKREKDYSGIDMELFELLRAKRAQIAQSKRVPAYIIFGDKTLRDMALKKPSTMEELSQIYGIGEFKLKTYGKIFLDVINGQFSVV